MVKKHTSISLDDQDHRALRALQTRYHLATASDALRFALRICDSCLAQYMGIVQTPKLTEPRYANTEVQWFVDRIAPELRELLFVVAAALELLNSHVQGKRDVEAKRFVEYGLAGVQQMQAVLSKRRPSFPIKAQGKPLRTTDRAGSLAKKSARTRAASVSNSADGGQPQAQQGLSTAKKRRRNR